MQHIIIAVAEIIWNDNSKTDEASEMLDEH